MTFLSPRQEPVLDHPLLGSVLRGTYRIQRVLDQGGMGIVFEVEHMRLRRLFAAKVLAAHLVSHDQARDRFVREAEIVSQLQHPNIVQIVDFDTTETGSPYIVMELLRGESLAACIERERRLDAPTTARIVFQAAAGLSAAHRAGVVHRDLKPGNVFLVDLPNEGLLVKLLDFGISRHVGIGSRRLTGSFDILGTPEYMPPEQARGNTALVDHLGDQYSLAVIAYEAMAGQTPFLGDSIADILKRVVESDPESIDHFVANLPTGVWPVLRRALSKEPSQRMPSVLTFATALLNACGFSLPPMGDPLTRSLPPGDDSVRPVSFVAERGQGLYRHSTLPSLNPESGAPPRSASAVEVTPTTHVVAQALADAREAFGLGDMERAADSIELAMDLADNGGAQSAEFVMAEGPLVESILESYLGSLTASLKLKSMPPASGETRHLSERAFLLSRIEGGASVEELLDVSPLPRRETLRHLVWMLRQRVLAIG